MFLGEYTTSLTSGRRIAVPKNYRQQFTSRELILARGYEGCVLLVEKSDFENLIGEVTKMPFVSADKREASRFLLSGACEVEPDSQGRVVVPDHLIGHAGLESGEVVFLGVGSWIEIWDKRSWEKYREELGERSAKIAQRLATLQNQT